MSKKSKRYDPAYKIEVCKTIDSGTATVSEMSRETGLHENTLYVWMKRYRENRTTPFVGSGNGRAKAKIRRNRRVRLKEKLQPHFSA